MVFQGRCGHWDSVSRFYTRRPKQTLGGNLRLPAVILELSSTRRSCGRPAHRALAPRKHSLPLAFRGTTRAVSWRQQRATFLQRQSCWIPPVREWLAYLSRHSYRRYQAQLTQRLMSQRLTSAMAIPRKSCTWSGWSKRPQKSCSGDGRTGRPRRQRGGCRRHTLSAGQWVRAWCTRLPRQAIGRTG